MGQQQSVLQTYKAGNGLQYLKQACVLSASVICTINAGRQIDTTIRQECNVAVASILKVTLAGVTTLHGVFILATTGPFYNERRSFLARVGPTIAAQLALAACWAIYIGYREESCTNICGGCFASANVVSKYKNAAEAPGLQSRSLIVAGAIAPSLIMLNQVGFEAALSMLLFIACHGVWHNRTGRRQHGEDNMEMGDRHQRQQDQEGPGSQADLAVDDNDPEEVNADGHLQASSIAAARPTNN